MDEANPVLSPQEPAHTHTTLKALITSLVVLVVGMVAAGLFFAGYLTPPSGTNSDVTLPGLLIMAVETQLIPGFPVRVIPAQYDLFLKDFLTPPIDKLTTAAAGGSLAYQHHLSGNMRWITFVGAVGLDSTASKLSDVPLQVYRADITNATYETITMKLQQAHPVTNDAMYKQSPAVSDSGDILYMARATGSSNQNNANSWSIYFIPSSGGEPQFLVNGVSPQWIDGSNFLFIADDGLKAFRLQGRYADLVWGVKSVPADTVTVNISRDKRFVASSFPDSGQTYIFRSLNGSANNLTLRGAIAAPGSHAVISPDDRFVALQAYAPAADGSIGKLAIQFYDLETLQAIPSAAIDINTAYPAIQASASAHSKGTDGKVLIGGVIDVLQPAGVVLTDWIP